MADEYNEKILEILNTEMRTYGVASIAHEVGLSVSETEGRLRDLAVEGRVHRTVHGYVSPRIFEEQKCAEQAA